MCRDACLRVLKNHHRMDVPWSPSPCSTRWACPEGVHPSPRSVHTPWRSGRIGSVGVEERLRRILTCVWEARFQGEQHCPLPDTHVYSEHTDQSLSTYCVRARSSALRMHAGGHLQALICGGRTHRHRSRRRMDTLQQWTDQQVEKPLAG